MKKIISLLLLSTLAFSLTACAGTGEGEPPADAQTPPAVESSAETHSPSDTLTPAPVEKERMVGITGSYIKDIQIGVSNFGMEDDSAYGAADDTPYRWTASKSWTFPDTSVSLDYSIIGDDDSQLISGSFGATWDAVESNDVFCAAAETYLCYIATMPYDSSDTDAARQWVSDNISTVAGNDPISMTIGDAMFTLSGTTVASGEPSSYLLQIQVVNP